MYVYYTISFVEAALLTRDAFLRSHLIRLKHFMGWSLAVTKQFSINQKQTVYLIIITLQSADWFWGNASFFAPRVMNYFTMFTSLKGGLLSNVHWHIFGQAAFRKLRRATKICSPSRNSPSRTSRFANRRFCVGIHFLSLWQIIPYCKLSLKQAFQKFKKISKIFV